MVAREIKKSIAIRDEKLALYYTWIHKFIYSALEQIECDTTHSYDIKHNIPLYRVLDENNGWVSMALTSEYFMLKKMSQYEVKGKC